MDKQILGALEIQDSEVRLIIGEFFNTRFNILKVERVPLIINDFKNLNKEEVIEAIKQAKANVEQSLNARLNKVILSIPSIDFKRYPLKVRVNIDGVVGIDDVKTAIKKASSTKIDDNLALIQAVCIKYTVNGISYRKIPLNEKGSDLLVNIDLLCIDRKVAFDLVSICNNAGLDIMDIYIDMYASAKEAAIFEQTIEETIILIKMESRSTYFSLIADGRMKASEKIDMGLDKFVNSVCDKYDINKIQAKNLVKYNARLDINTYTSNPIYIWNSHGLTKTISEKDLVQTIQPEIDNWMDTFKEILTPILQVNKTNVIIIGEAGEMQGFDTLFSMKLDNDVRTYTPDTLGARYCSLTTCLGLFYAYKDQLIITSNEDNSLDIDEFNKSITTKYGSNDDSGESITKKLRRMISDTRK